MNADDGDPLAVSPYANEEPVDYDDGNHPDYDTMEELLEELDTLHGRAQSDFEEGSDDDGWANLAGWAQDMVLAASKLRDVALPYHVPVKDQEKRAEA